MPIPLNTRVKASGRSQAAVKAAIAPLLVPAMLVAVTAGLAMVAIAPDMARTGWFGTKFALVMFLILATLFAGKLHREGTLDPAKLPTSRMLRVLNEVPTLLMLAIVALVIFKPF